MPRVWLTGFTLCLILIAQNAAIFWQHYIGTVSFPFDFTMSYYAMAAFWISLVQHGVFPHWVPFQSMGYPLVLSMQSGVFYPPLWLFTLFSQIPYTLHAAQVVQALHVLCGAMGCWLLTRLLGMSLGAALFAGVAFQFFGGFYSNAEHPDIVRAYAWLPWLFWTVLVLPTQVSLVKRNWLIPVVLLLFITGAYPGVLISQLFVLAVFSIASWMWYHKTGVLIARRSSIIYLQVVGLCVLGLLLASVYLWPTLQLQHWLVREDGYQDIRMEWLPSFWNAFILPMSLPVGDVDRSMISVFITVPAFGLLFLVSRHFAYRYWLWITLAVFTLLMAGGETSFLYRWLSYIIPPLGYSRFPTSDYRGMLGLALIVLASGILDLYLDVQQVSKFALRFALCAGLLTFYCFAGRSEFSFLNELAQATSILAPDRDWLVTIELVLLFFVSLHVLRKKPHALLAALIVLELLSGAYVLRRTTVNWRSDAAANTFYQERAQLDLQQTLPVVRSVMEPPPLRPARQDTGDKFAYSWRGYLEGVYMRNGYDSQTTPRSVVDSHPVLRDYMLHAWQAREISRADIGKCEPQTSLLKQSPSVNIAILSYGLQDVLYSVNATEDFCVVENEMLFPGWQGVIVNHNQSVEPLAYCGALRSWCLPKGSYHFSTRYETPGLRVGAALSLAAMALYLLLFILWYRVQRR